MNQRKAKELLSQVQTIIAYATCVEAEIQSFLGGVGTAPKRQNAKVDAEAIRQKARKQFSKP
ncbi:hypothetical protein [Chryseobacterium sp. R2A-55]|uniref:hypothetical protein n=1 Tax=Chryseobacterium sp. R2A-55 TaxID=2744445 RepID=UPI001F30CCF7|nr:hypothetical protein [Chryseobacterium sp. R2A-55]